MKQAVLKKAVALARKVGHIFVATSDAQGLPHVAAARSMTLRDRGQRVAVEAWFCPGTMANLQENRRISLVIWDPDTDQGHQLLGKAEEVEDLAILDGYSSQLENQAGRPQAERRLLIRVDKTLAFRHARHTDEQE